MSASTSERIARWVRPELRALKAYHVPPAAGLIKLDAMENPYGWPPELVDEWLERLREVSLNRYPDPGASAVKARLREAMAIPAGAELTLGNGSDELILLIDLALGGPGRSVLSAGPSFSMYRIIALTAGLDYHEVPLAEDFALDAEAMCSAIAREQPAVVFIAYPNNPTGNLFDDAAMRAVIEAAPGVVVVDEAYAAFSSRSYADALERYPNLLLLRTVSKMGLAGLRLGLLAGHPDWIEQIEKCRLPYNINVLTQVSAEFALEHRAVLEAQTARIRSDREHLRGRLEDMPGLKVWPSEANFLTFRVARGRAGAVADGLKRAGVLIKNLDGGHAQLADCLRVTVGSPEENEAFLTALQPLL